MRPFGLAAIIGLMLSSPVQAATNPQAMAYHRQLLKLSELQRFAVLRRAVLDSKKICKHVEAARPQGWYQNTMMWTAACTSKTNYALFIGPDGTVQVRDCKDAKVLGLPICVNPREILPRKKMH
jgi:hypothetical protein